MFRNLESNEIQISFIIPVKYDLRILECTQKLKEYINIKAIAAEIIVCGKLEQHMIPKDIWFIEVDPPDKGRDIRTGALVSRGDIIVISDADLPIPFTDLDKLISAAKKSNVALGNRYLPTSSIKDNRSFTRSFLSHAFRIIVQNLFKLKGFDTQCGIKALNKSSKAKLFEYQLVQGLAYDVELSLRAKLLGFTIAQIPIHLQPSSNSTISIWHAIFSISKEVLTLFYNFRLKNHIEWFRVFKRRTQAFNKGLIFPSKN